MSYFNSADVVVFPSTYRKYTSGGKYTSEQNFVNILNSLLDYDSYIIGVVDTNLEVVIHGYYFKISANKIPNGQGYLSIKVEKSNTATNSDSLVSFLSGSTINKNLDDDENNFTGLSWNDSSQEGETENYNVYSLFINKIDNNNITGDIHKLNSSRFVYDGTSKDKGVSQKGLDLNTVIDKKQWTLNAGNGLNINTQSDIVEINETEWKKLNSLTTEGVGSNNKFIYFSNGEFNESNAYAGSKYVKQGQIAYTQATYTEKGVLNSGTTFYASTESPNNQSPGQDGDIWFKYIN